MSTFNGNKEIYLDDAATTCVNDGVIALMQEVMSSLYANPSSSHASGRRVRRATEEARSLKASGLEASSGELLFTNRRYGLVKLTFSV